MKSWKKVCNFAGGIIYASGDLRKLMVNGNQVAAYKASDVTARGTETGNSQGNRRGR
jgi:hypothetical protein